MSRVCRCRRLDIDECALIPDICRHGYCVNTVGSFRCDCHPGYRYTPALYICEGTSSLRHLHRRY